MPVYKFVAKDQNGKQFTGEVESLDEKSVVSMLRKEKLVPIQIKSASSEGFLAKISVWRPGGGVSTSDIVTFTRQLSTMISAGLPLIDALVILQRQTSGAFPKVLGEIVTDIEGGMSLSQAFSRHSKVFDVIYIKLIEAGETGGVLDKVLNKLAQSLEKDREFKGKTRGAFIYAAQGNMPLHYPLDRPRGKPFA